jgi:hypothetical protein
MSFEEQKNKDRLVDSIDSIEKHKKKHSTNFKTKQVEKLR